ncbi:Glutathione S-transferase theta-1 [Chelonia mydas]|uniref:glutathione transferase n=1 Tax=Chelonia mydas TaxID=8469 RepID=M7B9A6_CHEMY|nr:Glutathione S-transferase theta-1 [Chelonia mydas]
MSGDELAGQQHSDGFGKVNVLRKVPALKDGDFTLPESPAILAYLSQKYKTPDHWYPLDMKKRAWVDEYLAWQHSAIRPSVLKIFWLKRLVKIRRRKKCTCDEMFSDFILSSHTDRAQQNMWRQIISECKKTQYDREERWRAEDAGRMGLELYLDLLSQPCRTVYIFAKKNNIPFEFKHVELFKGQHYREEFGKVNILKKVPALKDGVFTLAESTAILLYLSRKYNTPDHWYPSDIQKRARVDEYLSWHHTNIRANAPKTLWIKVLIPLFTGQTLPPEKLQEVMDELAISLKQFEEKFLQDKPFILGSEISLADLVAIVELMQPIGVGCDIFEDRPKLSEWRNRVEEAVGKELFQEAHEIILNIKELSNIQIDPQLKAHLAPVLRKIMK